MTPEHRRLPEHQNLTASLNQERYLFNLAVASGRRNNVRPFHVPVGFSLRGQLSHSAIEAAVHAFVLRHEALRVGFSFHPALTELERRSRLLAFENLGDFLSGTFVTSTYTWPETSVVYEDFSGLAAAESQKAIERALAATYKTPFDLTRPPLFRVSILRLRSDSHHLILDAHHLVADQWSIEIFQRELFEIYTAHATNRPVDLPNVTVHAPDFALRQQQRLRGGVWQKGILYWQDQWRRFASAQLSYADLTSGGAVGPPGEVGLVETVLDPDLSRNLTDLAKRKAISIFTIYLSAVLILLRNISGKASTAAWINLANRGDRDMRDVVGWFVNSHLVGVDFNGLRNVDDVLAEVHREVRNARLHQEIPLSLALRNAGIRAQVSDAKIIVEARGRPIVRAEPKSSEDIIITRAPLARITGFQTTRALTFTIDSGAIALTTTLSYALDRFSEHAVQHMQGQLESILRLLAASALTLH